jgi:CRP-like cAMP-binding protein
MTREGTAKLAAVSKTYEFLEDLPIFLRDEEPAAIWVVVHGRVWITDPDGETFAERCGRGIFGLTETIAGIPYSGSLLTSTLCTCTKIERDPFLRILRDETRTCEALLRILSRRYLKGLRRLASGNC